MTASVTEESVTEQKITLEDRIKRIDSLLCILFGGLTSHPLANTLVPPTELAELKRILPTVQPPDTGMVQGPE